MNLARLLDRWAREAPDHPALLAGNNWQSWRVTHDRIARVAAGLRTYHSLAPGDRIALLARNSAAFFEALLAIAWGGYVAVPLNWRLSAAEIAFQLADTEAKLVLADDDLCPLLAQASDGCERRSLVDTIDRYVTDARSIGAQVDVAGDDLFGIFYTGGTTGTPKGVMLTHGNLLANAANVQQLVPFAPSAIQLHAAPMFHLADLGYAFVSLAHGGAHVFQPTFNPGSTLDTIGRHGVTHTLLAPAMVDAIVRDADPRSSNLAHWQHLMYGGAPISEATLERALAVLPCGLTQGYGQTEATHTITSLLPADHRAFDRNPARRLSCGRAAPGVEIRIDAPPGESGEVCARGATIMRGYWRRSDETAATVVDGWLHTGDVGVLDAAGYLMLLDRKKDMIVSGAENVYSIEVENALARHPAVREVAVIAVPDERWGERVHAVVTLAPAAHITPEALQAHCRTLIGGYKVPRSFEFVASLPRSAAGKVQKEILRAPHWTAARRNIA
ncbi:MAG: AMP-binding protein [Burkholderiales bacterium]